MLLAHWADAMVLNQWQPVERPGKYEALPFPVLIIFG